MVFTHTGTGKLIKDRVATRRRAVGPVMISRSGREGVPWALDVGTLVGRFADIGTHQV